MDDEKRLTPMLAQYRQIKARYPDALVLFRLGDFYETFEADAKTAARELELALTARTFAKGVRLPMAGVPHHHVQAYIAKLIEKGYKVALVEQLEDPKKVRKLVKRDVVRLITPGTVVEDALLQAKRENYLAAIVRARRSRTHPDEADTAFGLALIDISTGEFATTQIEDPGAQTRLLDELQRVQASEFVLPQSLTADEEFAALIGALGAARISTVPDPAAEARRELLEHFHTTTLAPFGCEELPLAAAAAGLALRYLKSNQPNNENGSPLAHLNHLWTFSLSDTMTLDAATRRNLELTAPMQPADGVETFRRQTPAARSLFSVLDQTLTAMGARLLKRWIQQPLLDADLINARLDAVEELHRDVFLREDVRKLLDGLYDVERLVGRIGFGTAGARDLNALKRVLRRLPAMKALLARAQCAPLRGLGEQLDELQDVAALIDGALVDDPPSLIKEGGLIKRSYHAPLDELRERAAQGSGWLKALEETERQSTGIKSLRVRYNEVFGFFIEAPRSAAHLIPKHYERRATISHAERYVTPELKAQEAAILATADRIKDLEYELFVQLRRDVAQHSARLQAAARMLAQLDALAALAEAAARFHYVRPVVDDGDRIEIREGRHPVVERYLRDGESFVPNDTRLDGDTHRVLILTGPNMSGKSVFVRQVALIVLMAQMGSFVPASFAQVGLVDRIFTRVGASDDIAQGRSTFLVEMNEASHILRHASARSLLVLDEVGRGTSTYDGISLAWAIAEEIHNQLGAKTLFATHFHELTQLASAETITAHGGAVKNYTMAIKERGHEVVFLRQVIEGAAEKSFGIHVAQMAGLHPRLITRAQEILRGLEQSREPSAAQADAAAQQQRPEAQTALAVVREERALYEARRALWRAILRELAQVDVANMTPVQALVLLNEVKLKLSADAGAAQAWDSA